MSVAVHGYRLDRVGHPTADVICPHGHAIEHLNRRDYALDAAEDPAAVTLLDLADWLDEQADVLPEYCRGHR